MTLTFSSALPLRLAAAVALTGLAVAALAGCNEHAVDECFPLCSTVARSEVAFAECVADGSAECRPGDRRCCALEQGCIGDVGDQVVIGPAMCPVYELIGECLPRCDDDDRMAYEACRRGEDSRCAPDDVDCCVDLADCVGSLGPVAVTVVDAACCDGPADCLRGELCELETHLCLSAACDETGYCPPGHDCVDGACTCGDTGELCAAGEICDGAECVEDPCDACPAACLADGTCVECVTDDDCPALGEVCDTMTNACVLGCAADDATCDGFDDDCDSLVDEDFMELVGVECGVGPCINEGPVVCVEGTESHMCTPLPPPSPFELCGNGIDDDCNGMADDGCTCGDNVRADIEECDGGDLGPETCMDFGFDRGTLGCLADCTYDLSGCVCDLDTDMDGDCDSHDCAPRDPRRSVFLPDVCDGVDNDCDGTTDDPAEADLDCSDGLYCTGIERCVSGSCDFVPPPPCDDMNDCTMDPCDEAASMCLPRTPAPRDSFCIDGSTGLSGFCDGAGTCIPGT